MDYDVLIIGAGPAGLSAGLYASRAGLRTLLIERGTAGGQVTTTAEIENYPGSIENPEGMAMADRMRQQAENFGAQMVMDDIRSLKLSGEWKIAEGENGSYRGRALIFATGANPKKLEIDGEEAFTGRGVGYCATCDGAFYAGLPVFVVGGGDSAYDEALFLSKLCSQVTILYRGDKPRAARALQDRVAAAKNIEVVLNTNVVEISGAETMNRIVIENSKTHVRQEITGDFGLFIFAGYHPNTELLAEQLELDGGYVVAGEDTKTSIPGVYVAGDVRKKPVRQVVTAVADGAVAAIHAGKYVEEHFGLSKESR